MSAPEIARLMRTDESHVRKVIQAFNEEGFGSLDPDYRGGPHLAGMGILLSREALRQLLIDAGLSHQRTRSWTWSPDPDFKDKAGRVLSLYRAKPEDRVVVCFDEMGPIQLIPHHGTGWAARKRPGRLRAAYKRPHGVRYLFAAYDVHADRLHGRLREHKNAGEVLAFFKQIRMRYPPKLQIYLIMDNLSTHKTEAIREWAESNNVELVFTPTYACFLNRIECHLAALAAPGLRKRGRARSGLTPS